jgi:glutathione-independent formaldehyde dehydrogenase
LLGVTESKEIDHGNRQSRRAPTELNKKGLMALGFPAAWVKSPSFTAGQCPVMHYNRDLMMAIL